MTKEYGQLDRIELDEEGGAVLYGTNLPFKYGQVRSLQFEAGTKQVLLRIADSPAVAARIIQQRPSWWRRFIGS